MTCDLMWCNVGETIEYQDPGYEPRQDVVIACRFVVFMYVLSMARICWAQERKPNEVASHALRCIMRKLGLQLSRRC